MCPQDLTGTARKADSTRTFPVECDLSAASHHVNAVLPAWWVKDGSSGLFQSALTSVFEW